MSLFAGMLAKRELKAILSELQQYLSNNYKEPAHKARQKLIDRTEALHQEGALAPKDYQYWRAVGEEYTRKMADYHH